MKSQQSVIIHLCRLLKSHYLGFNSWIFVTDSHLAVTNEAFATRGKCNNEHSSTCCFAG